LNIVYNILMLDEIQCFQVIKHVLFCHLDFAYVWTVTTECNLKIKVHKI
jgi:hypothetical protein